MYVPSVLIAAIGLVLTSLLLDSIPSAAAEGSLTRNGAIGIRTKETLRSDEAWRAGHEAAGPVVKKTARIGFVLAAALGATLLFRAALPASALVCGGLGYAVVIGGTLRAAVTANQAARAIHGG